MRIGFEVQTAAVTLLCLLLFSSFIGVYGQVGTSVEELDKDFKRLRLRAEVMQKILRRAADAANISEALKQEAEELISTDLSALSVDELKEFVGEADTLLAEIRGSLGHNGTVSDEGVAIRLLERARERLNETLMSLNLTSAEAEQLRERIRQWIEERVEEGLRVRDVVHFMNELRGRLRHRKALRLYENTMNFTEKAARSGALFGLMNALNASSKVFEILERVKEKLESVNASPAAISAIEYAIEKIACARDVLRQLIERMHWRPHARNATKEQVQEELESILKEKLRRLNETIDEYLSELLTLREKAEEHNLTSLVEELNSSVAELKTLRKRIASENLSFSDAMSSLASIKSIIKGAERALEKASRSEKLSEELSKALKQAGEKLKERLEKLRERLNEAREKAGKHFQKVAEYFEETEKLISRAEENLKNAMHNEDIQSATKSLNKARRAADDAENLIDRLENLLRGAVKSTPPLTHHK